MLWLRGPGGMGVHLQKVAEAGPGALLEQWGDARQDIQDSVVLGCSQPEHSSAGVTRVLVSPDQGVVPELTCTTFSFQSPSARELCPCSG